MKKLELKNLKIKMLSKEGLSVIEGGCTGSICDGGGPTPTVTKGLGCTIPSNPGGSTCGADPSKPSIPQY